MSFHENFKYLHTSFKQNTSIEEEVAKQLKLFIKIVNNVCDILLSQLLKSCVKGDRLAIVNLEEEYQLCSETCVHNLHGRVISPKGAASLTVINLKTKLQSLWKLNAK